MTTANSVPSTLPHLRGPIIDQFEQAASRADFARIRAVTGGTVFIVWPGAAYYYLAGRMRDPLRFDFAQLSDLGSGGEAGVIRMLRRGDARWVCLRNTNRPRARRLEPVRLEAYVRRHFELVTTTRTCELYRQR